MASPSRWMCGGLANGRIVGGWESTRTVTPVVAGICSHAANVQMESDSHSAHYEKDPPVFKHHALIP
jgi:hypothetical protein